MWRAVFAPRWAFGLSTSLLDAVSVLLSSASMQVAVPGSGLFALVPGLFAALHSRRVKYLLAGLALAAGAPLGLLLVRAQRDGELSVAWSRREAAGDARTYVYVTLSTAVVFAAFGYSLGRQTDRLVKAFGTDSLTKLRTRRVMEERLEEEILHARRYRTNLSLLLIDLDGLKALNDCGGHRAGDAALRRAAAAVQHGSRVTDVAARWGGDEFALLAPNTSAVEARGLAERIRALAAQGSSITVSVGVATLGQEEGVSAEGLVGEADEALYEAKRLGRNRVVIA